MTVEKYINLLEQSYIIKVVRSFVGNKRGELKKAFKVYFIDLGIRNAVIDNINNDLESRNDKGVIFENLCIMELFKQNSDEAFPPEIMFWRTETKLEIDIIAKKNAEIRAYECKWGDKNVSFNSFLRTYKDAKARVISVADIINEKNVFI
jgi:predicted AAA+ superfamily ATPase